MSLSGSVRIPMHLTTSTCHTAQHSPATNSSYLSSNQNMHSLNSFNNDCNLTRANAGPNVGSVVVSGVVGGNVVGGGGATTGEIVDARSGNVTQRWTTTTRQQQPPQALSWHGTGELYCECTKNERRFRGSSLNSTCYFTQQQQQQQPQKPHSNNNSYNKNSSSKMGSSNFSTSDRKILSASLNDDNAAECFIGEGDNKKFLRTWL